MVLDSVSNNVAIFVALIATLDGAFAVSLVVFVFTFADAAKCVACCADFVVVVVVAFTLVAVVLASFTLRLMLYLLQMLH